MVRLKGGGRRQVTSSECGGVTRGEAWISWMRTGLDKIVASSRSGREWHRVGRERLDDWLALVGSRIP